MAWHQAVLLAILQVLLSVVCLKPPMGDIDFHDKVLQQALARVPLAHAPCRIKFQSQMLAWHLKVYNDLSWACLRG